MDTPVPSVLSRCHFCGDPFAPFAPTGAPAGGRTAFDAWQGRLWRICERCGRWSAAPLAARWEAVEACERLAREAGRVRLETDNLTLLVAGGAELVRVGRAPRPEFAGWRYGDRLPAVRRRGLLARWVARLSVLPPPPAGGVDFHGQPVAAPLGWAGAPFVEAAGALEYVFRHVPLAVRCAGCGLPLPLSAPAFGALRVVPVAGGAGVLAPCPRCRDEVALPLGHVRPALRLALAVVNRPLRRVAPAEAAGARVERAGGREAFVTGLAREELALGELEPTERLGLAVALDEAAEAELLERQWREAEELAALMDGELSPVPGYDALLAREREEPS